jgi:hypothetical protein
MAEANHTVGTYVPSGVDDVIFCLNSLVAGELPAQCKLLSALSFVNDLLQQDGSGPVWLPGCRYLLEAVFVSSCAEEIRRYLKLVSAFRGRK